MRANTTIRLAPGDHVVRFYEEDDDLVAVVTGYLGSALTRGEAAIVMATSDHAARVRAGFADAGLDVDAGMADSRLTILDAAETLAAFTAGPGPIDATAFDQVVRPVVRRAAGAGTGVCIYGEMVAMLFDEGRYSAALDLESCWNALGRRESFSLLCAYPRHAVETDEVRNAARVEVCHLHSDVIGDPPILDDATRSGVFARGKHAPKQARRFVGEVLREWGLAELTDRASLIVTELATNAVVHAQSGFTVSLSHSGSEVRIAVGDTATAVPQRSRAGSAALVGRGIPIIEALASRWGHLALDEGKLVWADIATHVRGPQRRGTGERKLVVP
jgi:hypothetical protein